MTDRTVQSLPPVLRDHLRTLEKIARDQNHGCSMCGSRLKAVHFDKLPAVYSRERHLPVVPCSNDALYISEDGKWYLIEFKNGSIDKAQLYRKLYDSLIILIEMGIAPDFAFFREKARYILVYNAEKHPAVPQSTGRDAFRDYIFQRSNTEERLFGVEKLQTYLLEETHTYTKEAFQARFVKEMEAQEAAAAGEQNFS
jgi:hypothetical protein